MSYISSQLPPLSSAYFMQRFASYAAVRNTVNARSNHHCTHLC